MQVKSPKRRDRLASGPQLPPDLAGVHVVVTAGPTHEPIDPVRYISNRSSGKMGYAIADCAARRGARVTLISGPVHLEAPTSVEVIGVVTAQQMHEEVSRLFRQSDVLVMSAAVADYRVASPSMKKLKRSADALVLELVPNPDILASVSRDRGEGRRPLIVGFALETSELLESAREKLSRKGCDLIVANLAGDSIGRDDSIAYIVDAGGVIDSPGRLEKAALAERILDHVVRRLELTAP